MAVFPLATATSRSEENEAFSSTVCYLCSSHDALPPTKVGTAESTAPSITAVTAHMLSLTNEMKSQMR